MQTIQSVSPTPALRAGRPVATRSENMATLMFSTWLILGVFVDGYFHNQPTKMEGFFTPWHGILYSGYAATALWIGFLLLRYSKVGFVGLKATPAGYELGVVGTLAFGFGGVLDLLWHTLFGIEQNINALYSPVHLLLIASSVLIGSSPLRAAWLSGTRAKVGWREFLPAFLGMLFSLSAVSFIIQLFWSFTRPAYAGSLPFWFGREANTFIGLSSATLTNVVMFGAAFILLRRWRVPFGTFALMFGINSLLMGGMIAFIMPEQIAAGFAGGLVADLLYAALKPSSSRIYGLRIWAFLAPVVLWSLHFTAIALFRGGVALTLEQWSGLILTAGLVGLVLSSLAFPPTSPKLEDGV